MELLKEDLIELIKQINRPDMLMYIYQIVIDIIIEKENNSNEQAS